MRWGGSSEEGAAPAGQPENKSWGDSHEPELIGPGTPAAAPQGGTVLGAPPVPDRASGPPSTGARSRSPAMALLAQRIQAAHAVRQLQQALLAGAAAVQAVHAQRARGPHPQRVRQRLQAASKGREPASCGW